jgi:hypothetical protein
MFSVQKQLKTIWGFCFCNRQIIAVNRSTLISSMEEEVLNNSYAPISQLAFDALVVRCKVLAQSKMALMTN